RLAVREEARGGRQDGHAEPAENAGDLGRLRVDAEAGLRDTLEACDGTLPAWAVLQLEREGLADACVLNLPTTDVALLLEDLRQVGLQLAAGHRHGVVERRIGVAQSGQHVCD